MRQYPKPNRKEEFVTAVYERWNRGLNTLVSNTQIRPDELAEASDVQLVEDGKIQFPRDGQAYWGPEIGNRVRGLFPFYKSDGTKEVIRAQSTVVDYYTTTTATTITGKTYTDNLDTNGVMAYDKLYLCNGTDSLTYYDGANITTFTELTAPGAPSVVMTSGTTGSYTYSYKITAINAVGETTPSVASTAVCNVATLDSSNYMTVTWTAVASAIGYNVYGRKDADWKFMTYLEGNATTTYLDKGTITPSDVFTPPEGNSTGGQKGKYIELYKDSLFIAGDTANPSRLYYSGGGDKIHDFTIENGGGFIDISKNDGQKITGMKVFKDSLIVFKEDSVYKFNFTTSGLPQVTQVNAAVGCIAPRSIVAVENDLFFASRRGIFTLGNEQGFAFDVIRTNELSAKVRSVYQTIESAYIDRICAIYATKNNLNLVIFAYTPAGSTTNSKALIFDREKVAWLKWNNINAGCFLQHIDSTNAVHVLYGADDSGYVCEMFSGTDDFGTSIGATAKLKAEGFNALNRYKKLKMVDLLIRQPLGSATVNIITDGVVTEQTVNIGTVNPSTNFGHYVFTEFLFGESVGTGLSTQDENILRTVKNPDVDKARSYMLELKNGTGSSFTLLTAAMRAKLKSETYRQTDDLIST
jgi:hypothetical protein